MCKSKHDINHYIINYELKNYYSKFHNGQKYTSYCNTCKLNICISCSEKHDGHEIIFIKKYFLRKKKK